MIATAQETYPLAMGTRLDEYIIKGVLGQGGFGVTYLAVDENLEHEVAIKQFSRFSLNDDSTVKPGDPETDRRYGNEWALDSFVREARIMAQLDHPNLVKVRRFFRMAGSAFIVMDFVRGKTLDDLIAQAPTGIAEPQLNLVLHKLLSGLQVIHERGVLHRDIKPRNIILRADDVPVLLDFGSARQYAGRNGKELTTIVTHGYAPIEQYSPDGEQGPYTDLYGLAAVAYYAITGKPPPEATSRVLRDTLVSAREAGAGRYSPMLLAAVDRALAIDPRHRFQTAAEMCDSLPAPDARPATGASATAYAGKRRRRPWVAYAIAAVVAASAAAAYMLSAYKKDTFGPGPADVANVVDAAGTGRWRSVRQALDEAAPNSTIVVRAGTYDEMIAITKPVTLVGEGKVEMRPPTSAGCVTISGAGSVTLRNLSFRARGGACIEIVGAAPVLEDLEISGTPRIGVLVRSNSAPRLARIRVVGAGQNALSVEENSRGAYDALEVIGAGDAGVRVLHGSAPAIENSTIRDTAAAGILVAGRARPKLAGNTIARTGLSGIEVADGAVPEVHNNTVTDSAQAGIFIHGGAGGSYSSNTVTGTVLSGIIVEGGAPTLNANRIIRAGEHGVYVTERATPTLSRNVIEHSKAYAIAADRGSAPVLQDNRLQLNRAPQIVGVASAR